MPCVALQALTQLPFFIAARFRRISLHALAAIAGPLISAFSCAHYAAFFHYGHFAFADAGTFIYI